MKDMFKKGLIRDADYLNSILETIADGVMVVDTEGKIVSLNKAAEEITGYRKTEVRGKPCSILDTDACANHKMTGEKIHCDLFKKGRVIRKQCQIRSKDGNYVQLLKNAVILKDKRGRAIGAVETMTDVSSLFMKDMEIEELRQTLNKQYGFMGLLGKSPAMQKVFDQIKDSARSNVPIMILGESGTGKELVAHAIHQLSKKNRGPFVKVNCAALNEHLLESELFGHRKGSFTGAIKDRKGRFEAAHKGTLFLDEIGDMSLSMQAKLLRALQEKEIERVGDNKPVRVDVRIIAATNKDINTLLKSGSFREDLFYRINVFPVHLPPLRERTDDIPVLAAHYLKKISIMNQKDFWGISKKALDVLQSYHWPGNVRQLINVLEYGAVSCKCDTIDTFNLPEYLTAKKKSAKNKSTSRDDDQKDNILKALKDNNYNRSKAADQLNISRVALWKKMKRLGVSI